ncbi:glutathione S-transferase family protein [Leptospira licerasiae]|uniref:Glutathione S-transferase, N-terminal domain protein n=1 Tax=Leptospira licerasiae str. MMD4847 TaxID=1049971 RepID=A0ABP2RKL6_9LEPT|nr:glutathione S-transferase family protein [Leptospira licerasiae]EIE02680.1 glutathione S-transferase, N-terminal domain protein [Leptospira licerasiae serovar Varillal str. VAR 010]EJZ43253.1 glutathione S-transferase, N-terminal domain protein [Leptospira licerasiae str. MMD4847]
MKVYGTSVSGNCYKIKLLLHLLKIPYEWIEINVRNGETKTKEFLLKNPVGKVPLLELDSGEFLSESNAILYFLANKTDFFPNDLLIQSRILQWMFFEQYSHEPYIAVNRSLIRLQNKKDDPRISENLPKGMNALRIMDDYLAKNQFFGSKEPSIADISLFAYTHVAEEGQFSLADFPNIISWIERIKKIPNFIPIY